MGAGIRILTVFECQPVPLPFRVTVIAAVVAVIAIVVTVTGMIIVIVVAIIAIAIISGCCQSPAVQNGK